MLEKVGEMCYTGGRIFLDWEGFSMSQYSKLKGTLEFSADAWHFAPEDYGALGDGITDDGPAFLCAIRAMAEAEPDVQKVLHLRPRTTYRILTTDGGEGAVISLKEARNMAFVGDESYLCVKLPAGGIRINRCEQIIFAGIELGFDPSPMFNGRIEHFTRDGRTFDFRIDEDETCGFAAGETEYTPPYGSAFFMIPNDRNLRQDFFIEKMELIAPGHLRVTQNVEMIADRIQAYMAPVKVGDPYILPRVGLAHRFPAAIDVTESVGISFASCQVHDVPCFAVHLLSNADLHFRDFHLRPRAGSGNDLVAWRDGFHCKNQYRLATWEDCTVGLLGDDVLNLATTFFDITAVIDERTFCIYPQERSLTQVIRPGDTIGILDQRAGVKYGEATVVSCVKGECDTMPATLTVDRAIDGLERGKHMEIVYTSENPTGHLLRNCTLLGAMRIKAPTRFEHCDMVTSLVYICNEAQIEGPLPRDITFKDCRIISTMPGQTWINAYPEIPANETLLACGQTDNLVLYVDTNGTGPRAQRQLKTKHIVIDHCTVIGRMAFNGNEVEVIN